MDLEFNFPTGRGGGGLEPFVVKDYEKGPFLLSTTLIVGAMLSMPLLESEPEKGFLQNRRGFKFGQKVLAGFNERQQ